MAKVDYPTELTQAYWDKKKPTLAKTKKTGIGEALKSLKKAHDDIKWGNFEAQASIIKIDELLELLPKECKKVIEPVAEMAKSTEKLCRKWAGDFTKDKLMPKAAATAATDIADAAKKYAAEMEDFQGAAAKELVQKRKEFVAAVGKSLKPIWTKTSTKIDGLLVDIRNYANNPTEENFWSIFTGDSNARGYVTGCKNWDQLLIEFPDLRSQCYKGDAMKDFFPGMADYGANWAPQEFDQKVNSKTGKQGSECYIWHAKHLIKEVPNIRKFQAVVQKLLALL